MRKIATTVYTSEEVVVSNEVKEITFLLRPLPIARLREFMVQWDKLKTLQEEKGDELTENDIFSVYIKCCAVALRKQAGQHYDGAIFDDRKDFTQEYIDFIEDYLDLPTVVKILDICGGITLNDPKLRENLEALMALQAEDGQI